MTCLATAGQALHFEAITQRALAQKLISPQGLTLDATMGSCLYTDTKQARIMAGRVKLSTWDQIKGFESGAG
jgi:hypothetical protein